MKTRLLFWLSAFACLGACGARSDPEGVASALVCGLPSLAPEGPFTEEDCAGSCTLGSIDEDGNPVRLACDGQRCVLFVDGVRRCTCTELDYANVCGNGVPICRDIGNFNFAATTPVGCAPGPSD